MTTARSRKTGSSDPWYLSWHALTDSASMRACAGSYTPQGRSQCAATVRRGARMRSTNDDRDDMDDIDDPPPSSDDAESASYRRGPGRMPRAIPALAAVAVAGWGFVRYRPSRVA